MSTDNSVTTTITTSIEPDRQESSVDQEMLATNSTAPPPLITSGEHLVGEFVKDPSHLNGSKNNSSDSSSTAACNIDNIDIGRNEDDDEDDNDDDDKSTASSDRLSFSAFMGQDDSDSDSDGDEAKSDNEKSVKRLKSIGNEEDPIELD